MVKKAACCLLSRMEFLVRPQVLQVEEEEKRLVGMILINKFVLSGYDFNAGISLMLYQAHMREQMSQRPEGSDDPIARNDVYASVMGPERRGRVRGLGFGVSPSNIWGKKSIPNSSTEENFEIETLRHQNVELQQKYADLQQKIVEMEQIFGQHANNENMEIAVPRELFQASQR